MLRASNYTSYCNTTPKTYQSTVPTTDSGRQSLLGPSTSLTGGREGCYIPYRGRATEGWIDTMTDTVIVERRRSYGRGGAGNLRRPSEVAVAEQAIFRENDARRRSSTLSSTVGEGRRASIVKIVTGIFGKKGEEPKEVVTETMVQE